MSQMGAWQRSEEGIVFPARIKAGAWARGRPSGWGSLRPRNGLRKTGVGSGPRRPLQLFPPRTAFFGDENTGWLSSCLRPAPSQKEEAAKSCPEGSVRNVERQPQE